MKKFLFLFFIIPLVLGATDLSPWLTRYNEFLARGTVLFQHYPEIKRPEHNLDQKANDRFYTLSIGGTFCLPFDGTLICGLSGELELTVADTMKQKPNLDNIRLTARYLLWDDVGGDDPFTLTTGLTLIQAFRHSVHDISSFHHGQFEAEFHVAIGKEMPDLQFWKTHSWIVLGLGTADVGSPWIRGDVYWEYNWYDQHQIRLFTHTLWGLGGNNLPKYKSFHGYGPIHHQSIDVGARYSYLFFTAGILSVEYARRIYAWNFPEKTNLILLSFVYPFGL